MSNPKDAASLILLKKINLKTCILMGRRPPKQIFMPDIFVFPGGKVERSDGYAEYSADLNKSVKKALMKNSTEHRARAIALAAIRETFEETGLMVGNKNEKFLYNTPKIWQNFKLNKIKPRLDVLSLIARAITPRGQSRRFDARFFAVDSCYAHGNIIQNDELLEIDWYPIEYIRKNLPLAQVTELVINQIENIISKYKIKNHSNKLPIFSRRKGERVIRYDKASGILPDGIFKK